MKLRKSKLKYILVIFILVSIYIFGTPIGALRFALIRGGYIKTAFISNEKIKTYCIDDIKKDNNFMKDILYDFPKEDAPYSEYNESTEGERIYYYMWSVTKIGIIYYGWEGEKVG